MINPSQPPGMPACAERAAVIPSPTGRWVSLLVYALMRAIRLVPTFLFIVTLAFFVIRLAPGGPFDTERTLSPAVRANLDARYGLNDPVLVQYGRYLRGVVLGDLGYSFRARDAEVSQLIAQGLPVSLKLGAWALVIGVFAGVVLGATVIRGRRTARIAVLGFVALALALPTFIVGPMLLWLFGLQLRWLPVAGWEGGDVAHLLLPALALALPLAAAIAQLTRTGLRESLGARFVRTARANGLSEARILWRHAMRPALLPVVGYLGPATATILVGSLVVETVFSLPGTGRFLVQAAIDRDYTLVMGMLIVYSSLTLLCNLAADILYAWLDPRITYA
jgi:oligopeptide transport system permease protein